MSSTYTTREVKGFGARMSSACGGLCIGLILFIAAFPLLAWNEHNAVNQATALDEARALAIEAPSDAVDKSLAGKLVHVSGDVSSDGVEDADFGIRVNSALRLTRHSEAYQMLERSHSTTRREGGKEVTDTTYSYEPGWSSSLVASSTFKDSRHRSANAGGWKVPPTVLTASNVRVGAYRLPSAVVESLGQDRELDLLDPRTSALGRAAAVGKMKGRLDLSQPTRVDKLISGRDSASKAVSLPVSTAVASMQMWGNELYTGNPHAPAVGDNRVKFTVADPRVASVLGKQTRDGSLAPFVTSNGREILLYSEGDKSIGQLFAQAHAAAATQLWLLRIAGWALMLFGLLAIFQPISVAPQFVPLIGPLLGDILSCGLGLMALSTATALSVLVIAVAWLTARPLMSAGLIAAAVGILYLVRSQRRSRSGASAGAGAGASADAAGDAPPAENRKNR